LRLGHNRTKVRYGGIPSNHRGLLLFGKNPSLYLPHVYVKVVYNGEARLFFGNILKMLDDVSDYMRSIIKVEGYPLMLWKR